MQSQNSKIASWKIDIIIMMLSMTFSMMEFLHVIISNTNCMQLYYFCFLQKKINFIFLSTKKKQNGGVPLPRFYLGTSARPYAPPPGRRWRKIWNTIFGYLARSNFVIFNKKMPKIANFLRSKFQNFVLGHRPCRTIVPQAPRDAQRLKKNLENISGI